MEPSVPFTPPALDAEAFNCPHCNAYARQTWTKISYILNNARHTDTRLLRAQCDRCSEPTLWHDGHLIYPDAPGVVAPSADLSEQIRKDYAEAASILNRSPRGACALLRLCVQNLCVHLGKPGKDLNDDIASLVKAGMPVEIQRALDVLRVIGNNAVHPGEIDLRDDRDTAGRLFNLLNLITNVMITQPREIAAMYEGLPARAREAIKKRDAPSS